MTISQFPGKIPSAARMEANITAELTLALQACPSAAGWYRAHHETIAAWAEDHGVSMEAACAAAASISPGLDPARETDYLSWIVAREPNGETRPHGYGVPRGYAPMVRGRECLQGVRPMPNPDVKTGNYARSILDPASPDWCAVDVHSFRTACGDPIGTTRKLPSLTPTEYRAIRLAFQTVATRFGMLASEVQAVTWVYRRDVA